MSILVFLSEFVIAPLNIVLQDVSHEDVWYCLAIGVFIGIVGLGDAYLNGTSLAGARLVKTDFRWAGLSGANLSGATLTRAHLARADLAGANLSGANLAGATLTGASLRWADITGADLTGATLTGADLRWTTLVGADLTGARLSEGVACGRAIGGHVGGHHWWAVGLEDGGAVLQFGCEHHILEWWLAQGPDLCVRHGHPVEFWEQGPAVAIAAAQALSQAAKDVVSDG